MADSDRSTDERIEEFWSWFAVALFLLLTVDLLTTFGATVEYGLSVELNPEAWLGRIVALGLFVFVSNRSFLVFGDSLA